MSYNVAETFTLGGHTFYHNPAKYSVKFRKLETQAESLNGTLQSTSIDDGTGKCLVKRSFAMSGITPSHPGTMLEDIEEEFASLTNITFVSPLGVTHTVRMTPDGFQYDVDESSPWIPSYSLELREV